MTPQPEQHRAAHEHRMDEHRMTDIDVQRLQELLSSQTREVESLSKELVASYKKEILFFCNLEQRDQASKKAEKRSLKKIWWLESEWRRSREALETAQTELAMVRSELETVRAQRDALRGSLVGRVQRFYWRARKRIMRGGRA